MLMFGKESLVTRELLSSGLRPFSEALGKVADRLFVKKKPSPQDPYAVPLKHKLGMIAIVAAVLLEPARCTFEQARGNKPYDWVTGASIGYHKTVDPFTDSFLDLIGFSDRMSVEGLIKKYQKK